jgi:hypothetical protein
VVTEVLRLHGEVPQVSQLEVGAPAASDTPVVAAGDAALDDPTSPEVPEEAAAAVA